MPRGLYVRRQKAHPISEEVALASPVQKPGGKRETPEEMLSRIAEKYEEKACRYRKAVRVLQGERDL